jgi:exodeoxyribonuclease V alpha subunit
MMPTNNLQMLYQEGLLTELDLHFAGFMSSLAGEIDPDFSLAAALVSSSCGKGDVCLDLSSVAGRNILTENMGQQPVVCPPLVSWRSKLESNAVVGKPGDKCPLILDDQNRLYLYRYWNYERQLAHSIQMRARQRSADIDIKLLNGGLKRLFPEISRKGTDWQKVACLTALFKKICIISGGPGSGKTFTVTKILALLIEQYPGNKFRILLAAPTGKAATRLAESILEAKTQLNCSPTLINAIPQDVLTIHRMLRVKKGSSYFYFNRENPLPADVVIIDEASMVDLALMSKIVQAMPETARLVLIGDKDQLASVEAGAVLGDICDRDNRHGFSESYCTHIQKMTDHKINITAGPRSPKAGLNDCLVNLTGSYRFGSRSDIGELSLSVNQGDARQALALLKNTTKPTISLAVTESANDLFHLIKAELTHGQVEYLNTRDPDRALKLFNRFTFLCALRIGPFGVQAVNWIIEHILIQNELIRPDRFSDNPWYKGRPVLVTSNDYNLGLFNGDIGITLPDTGPGRDKLCVFFPGDAGQPRRFSPYVLPAHETVYAMTVHKSQGSEFENVILVLPDRDSPVLTRELIYTAITRARKTIKVLGNENIILSAISKKIERKSGLRDALWGSAA